MKGTESQILKVVKEMGDADNEAIARKMNTTQRYVATICKNLVKDGYLKEKALGKYMLTLKSEKSISPVVAKGGVIAVLKGGL